MLMASHFLPYLNSHLICGVRITFIYKLFLFLPELLAAAPAGASVPSLGLSNKAVFDGETVISSGDNNQTEFPEGYFTPVSLAGEIIREPII